eukprot:43788-Eustigmatos_ZCMA.PRE.1
MAVPQTRNATARRAGEVQLTSLGITPPSTAQHVRGRHLFTPPLRVHRQHNRVLLRVISQAPPLRNDLV